MNRIDRIERVARALWAWHETAAWESPNAEPAQNAYVKQATHIVDAVFPQAEDQPDPKGLAAAQAYTAWHIGDRSWAAEIVRAYLNPEIALAELKREKGEQ
jgi:hypothetical protein